MKSYCNCPNCGKGIELHAMQQHRPQLPPGFAVENRHRMEMSYGDGAIEPPIGMKAIKKTPTRAPNFEADVKVPLIKSWISGTLAQVISWVTITGWLGYFNWIGFFFTWFIFIGLAWLAVTRGIDSLMYIYEEITNDSPEPPKPEPTPPKEIAFRFVQENDRGEPGQQKVTEVVSGVTNEMFVEWATAVLSGVRGLSESDWTGSGNLFSKAQYKNLMAAVGEGGIVTWKDPKHPAQGRILTNGGRHQLRSLTLPR